MHHTPIHITPLQDLPNPTPSHVDLPAQAYPHTGGGWCDDGLCAVIGDTGHQSWRTLGSYVDGHYPDGSIRRPAAEPLDLSWLDTDDTLAALPTDIALLDTDRPRALATARVLSAEVLFDISGRVAR